MPGHVYATPHAPICRRRRTYMKKHTHLPAHRKRTAQTDCKAYGETDFIISKRKRTRNSSSFLYNTQNYSLSFVFIYRDISFKSKSKHSHLITNRNFY